MLHVCNWCMSTTLNGRPTFGDHGVHRPPKIGDTLDRRIIALVSSLCHKAT